MTYGIDRTTAFLKDVARAKRRGLDLSKLTETVVALANGRRLPPSKRDHALRGEWSGCRECHVSPDWLLVYRVAEAEVTLYLLDTGTHSDLFGR